MSKRTRTRPGHADPTTERRRRRERVARGPAGEAWSAGRYTSVHVHGRRRVPRKHVLCDGCDVLTIDMDVVQRGRSKRAFDRAVEIELRRSRPRATPREDGGAPPPGGDDPRYPEGGSTCAKCGRPASEHTVLPDRGCAETGCESFAWHIDADAIARLEGILDVIKRREAGERVVACHCMRIADLRPCSNCGFLLCPVHHDGHEARCLLPKDSRHPGMPNSQPLPAPPRGEDD